MTIREERFLSEIGFDSERRVKGKTAAEGRVVEDKELVVMVAYCLNSNEFGVVKLHIHKSYDGLTASAFYRRLLQVASCKVVCQKDDCMTDTSKPYHADDEDNADFCDGCLSVEDGFGVVDMCFITQHDAKKKRKIA